jgi:enoyl-CoA hydratase/carnithine racemase
MLCLGRPFSAKKAFQAGLVNEVVEDNVDAAAKACAEEIAAKPPEAMALSREFLRKGTAELSERVDEEAKVFASRLTSPEAISAFQAFMAKKSKS